MPAERLDAMPWVIDPATGSLITPFVKRARGLTLVQEQQVRAMLTRLAALRQAGLLPRETAWVWPDRDPELVGNDNPTWLLHWMRDRAAFRVGR